MIHDLSRDASAPSADPLADWSPAGDVDKAAAAVNCLSVAGEDIAENRSRANFLRALDLLGPDRGLDNWQPDSYQSVPVYVGCPYETWVKVFGEPESVTEHREALTRLAVHVWKHHCKDGPVTCVGHIFENSSGSRWVIVFRIGFFPMVQSANDADGPTLLGDGHAGASPSALQRSKQYFGQRIRAIADECGDKELLATCADSSFVPVHVSCSYEAWASEFGEPRSVVEYRNDFTGLALNVWQQDCPNGFVTCIGHIFEHSNGGRWVVLVRVRFD
jgi:hypothetical protein